MARIALGRVECTSDDAEHSLVVSDSVSRAKIRRSMNLVAVGKEGFFQRGSKAVEKL